MASTVITDYFFKGTHAARPATPNVPAGVLAFYYETDTTNLFCWTGSAWKQITGASSSGPTIVQTSTPVCGAGIQSVTFGVAPINGDLLVVLAATNSNRNANTGWAKASVQDNSGTDFGVLYWKVAGAGESTTQTPWSATDTGAMVAYEINGGAPVCGLSGNPGSPLFQDTTSSSPSGTLNLLTTGGLVLGFLENTTDATHLPSSFSGVTADGSNASGSSRTIQGFTTTSGLGGTTLAISASYGASVAWKLHAWQIH